MNSTKLWTTAQIPSCIGMPIYGHAFGTTSATDLSVDRIVRERAAAATTGAVKRDMSLVQSFPGTSAWRPPSC